MPKRQGNPMGDGQNGDLRVDFDRRLRLKFLGSKVTTDAGLLAYRELDETFGLTEVADGLIGDSRIGKNKTTRSRSAAAPVDLQPIGGLRRCQRCPTIVRRPGDAARCWRQGKPTGQASSFDQ